jgi:hypothetical protein
VKTAQTAKEKRKENEIKDETKKCIQVRKTISKEFKTTTTIQQEGN